MYKLCSLTIILSLAWTSLSASTTSVATSSSGICDYRPSNLIGSFGSGAASVALTSGAATGAGMKVAGFYTLTHAVTGATMLGSTAGGASAAGTVGIMGGTAGAIGSVAAIMMSPIVIVTGVVIGAGIAVYEGACYFGVQKINDPNNILKILEKLERQGDPRYFKLKLSIRENSEGAGSTVELDLGNSYLYVVTKEDEYSEVLERKRYTIDKLYIEDGILKHSDILFDTKIGRIGYVDESRKNTE